MSDWQPAIARNVHGFPDPENSDGKKVLVRSCALWDPDAIQRRIEMGCDPGVNFFEIEGAPGLILCEHEILTD